MSSEAMTERVKFGAMQLSVDAMLNNTPLPLSPKESFGQEGILFS